MARRRQTATTDKAWSRSTSYGNWKVTDLRSSHRSIPFGHREGKIEVQDQEEAIEARPRSRRRTSVGRELRPRFALTEVASTGTEASAVQRRTSGSKPRSPSTAVKYHVSFGSNDNGESLKIQVVSDSNGSPGGTGTGVRGGG